MNIIILIGWALTTINKSYCKKKDNIAIQMPFWPSIRENNLRKRKRRRTRNYLNCPFMGELGVEREKMVMGSSGAERKLGELLIPSLTILNLSKRLEEEDREEAENQKVQEAGASLAKEEGVQTYNRWKESWQTSKEISSHKIVYRRVTTTTATKEGWCVTWVESSTFPQQQSGKASRQMRRIGTRWRHRWEKTAASESRETHSRRWWSW